ncbi:hypothetical protein AKO1_013509 [Acrasis kona]|uniref:Uncharacterized protein n=1 Tax=Acrasis kona TaxID=1008807 RepID=A0AAW2ZHU2_9EUKA
MLRITTLVCRHAFIQHSRKASTLISNNKFFLGLDISSRVNGFAILDENGKVVEIGSLNLAPIKNEYEYGKEMKRTFENFRKKNSGEWIVAVEAPLKNHALSQKNTLIKLQRYNALASYEAQDIFSVEPRHIDVNSARRFFNIKKDDSSQIKKLVYDAIKHLLPDTYQTKLTKRGNICTSNFDATDALLIALYSYCTFNINNKADAELNFNEYIQKVLDSGVKGTAKISKSCNKDASMFLKKYHKESKEYQVVREYYKQLLAQNEIFNLKIGNQQLV